MSPREEFESLFKELTNMSLNEAQVGEDGFVFVPPEVKLGEKDSVKRLRISELANHQWRNNLVDDDYAGWWIKPPA